MISPVMDPDTRKTIIFLCSYNSVRSQIAEGLMRYCTETGTTYTVRESHQEE